MTKPWRMSSVQQFIGTHEPGRFPVAPLYAEYVAWCAPRGLVPAPLTFFGPLAEEFGARKFRRREGLFLQIPGRTEIPFTPPAPHPNGQDR